MSGMSFDRARAVADAVLLEGYLLYPYRASSRKNRYRWTFGVLAPKAWSAAGGCERSRLQLQCLVSGRSDAGPGDPLIEGRLRFFQLVQRRVEKYVAGCYQPAASMEVDDQIVIPWDEGQVHEVPLAAALDHPTGIPVHVPGGREEETIVDGAGHIIGRVVRERWPVSGEVVIRAEVVAATRPLHRLTVTVENVTSSAVPGVSRDQILCASMLATHLCLGTNAEFLSAMDPPAWAAEAAARCQCVGTYPVLAGKPGDHDLLLAAPIVLYDHPEIAPESTGDFYDSTEIDEMLTLRTMTLTPEEKREMRATDRRAAELLDRVESMPELDMERLHGAIRSRRELPRELEPVPPQPGDRVRVRAPVGRTDAQDLLYAGRFATVEKVLRDVDGDVFVAVTFEEDPAAELHRWYGRFHYYRLSEIDRVEPQGGLEVSS